MVLGAIVEGVYGQLARGRRRYDGGERIRGDFMVRDCLGGPVLVGFLTLSPVTLLAGSSFQVPGTHWRCSLWPRDLWWGLQPVLPARGLLNLSRLARRKG